MLEYRFGPKSRILAVDTSFPPGDGYARFGAEYQPAGWGVPGLTLFADGRVGEHDYSRVIGGLRLYFGGAKSLKDRHRLDDPGNVAQEAADVALSGDQTQAAGSVCPGVETLEATSQDNITAGTTLACSDPAFSTSDSR